MQLCLSFPGDGYYMKDTNAVFGARGDFTTSPEISQVFGEVRPTRVSMRGSLLIYPGIRRAVSRGVACLAVVKRWSTGVDPLG